VVIPGFPADVFLNFLGLCISLEGDYERDSSELFSLDAGLRAFEILHELAAFLPASAWDWNPIAVYEAMAGEGHHAYCPFAYTYNNYARDGFARFRLRFTDPPAVEAEHPVRTILGGTGLAISTFSHNPEAAFSYAQAVVEWQSGIYALAGGQPALRQAWSAPSLNTIAGGFFQDTLPSLERAVIRPRYAGYTEFQAVAGEPLVECLRHGGAPRQALEKVRELYRESRRGCVHS
jgi:multiple sugar transport system substrate-binding protein